MQHKHTEIQVKRPAGPRLRVEADVVHLVCLNSAVCAVMKSEATAGLCVLLLFLQSSVPVLSAKNEVC